MTEDEAKLVVLQKFVDGMCEKVLTRQIDVEGALVLVCSRIRNLINRAQCVKGEIDIDLQEGYRVVVLPRDLDVKSGTTAYVVFEKT